jgi:hypothetical protein
MCLPHIHHHEKKYKRTMSGNNLTKLASSNNFQELPTKKGKYIRLLKNLKKTMIFLIIDVIGSSSSIKNVMSKSNLKYQYSFTDSMALEDFSSSNDFKVSAFLHLYK